MRGRLRPPVRRHRLNNRKRIPDLIAEVHGTAQSGSQADARAFCSSRGVELPPTMGVLRGSPTKMGIHLLPEFNRMISK
jgi:hypothetical protein